MTISARKVWGSLVATVLAAGLVVGGCFGQDGDAALLKQRFRAKDGSYALDYVSPPWRVETEEDNLLRLVIDTEVFGISVGSSIPPTHLFYASKVELKDTLKQLLESDVLKDLLAENGINSSDIPDTLPDLGDWPDQIPGDDSTGTGEEIVPEYLVGVDLHEPRDVAVAELNFLIEEQNARLYSPLEIFETRNGLRTYVYQVVIDPGVFLRNFYVQTENEAVRLSFASLFTLENADIELMVDSLDTDLSRKTAGGNQ